MSSLVDKRRPQKFDTSLFARKTSALGNPPPSPNCGRLLWTAPYIVSPSHINKSQFGASLQRQHFATIFEHVESLLPEHKIIVVLVTKVKCLKCLFSQIQQ